jgi:tetratricopeptide (TPR) repeat protein
MAPEGTKRVNAEVERLFAAAVELPKEQREEFLARECSDPALRRELETLLLHDGNAEALLERAVSSEAAALMESVGFHAGDRVGHYRIVSLLGRGGMGTVYLAQRADGKFEQKVAIKVIHSGPDRAGMAARLQQEYRILASLEHPNIARMVDAGAARGGLPYFAMEYVAGEPIDLYCEKLRLPVRERLRLLLPLCDAVQFAHQSLVVHRDLKPGNILVDRHGVPRLLDFGIAKVLDAAQSNTDTAAWMLTPDYASPEQARGDAASTATDIYSLGGVLYKLLTGLSPHPLHGKSPLECLRTISEGEIRRPSEIRRELSRELDDMVRMAMAPEPARRYRSADRFAADIEDWLAGRPLAARRDTVWYRAGKFTRRHWIGVTSAAAAALALGAGVATIAWEANRAERRFADVRHLASVSLFDIEHSIHNLTGATKARLLVVNTAEEYLQRLSKEAGGDAGLTRELAAAYEKLGDIQGGTGAGNIGDAAAAAASYQQAVTLLKSLSRSAFDNTTLVEVLNKLSGVQERTPNLDAARRSGAEALSLATRLAQAAPKDTHAGHLLASAKMNMAELELRGHDVTTARTDMQSALALEESLADASGSRADRASLAAETRAAATLLEEAHDYDQAMAACRKAVALYAALAAEDPADPDIRRNRMIALTTLGSLEGQFADDGNASYAPAIAAQREAYGIASQAADADPANAEAQSDLAAVAIRLAHTLADAHMYSQALSLPDRSIQVSNGLVDRDPDNREFRSTLAFGYAYRGYMDGLKGDLDGAVREQNQAAKIYGQAATAAPNDAKLLDYEVWNWLELGRVLVREKNWDAAHQVFERAIQVAEGAGKGNPEFQGYLKDLRVADRKAAQALALHAAPPDGAPKNISTKP